MLFRIEAAVITGVTRPTCTSRLSEWTVPSKNNDIIPGRISKVLIKKDHCTKKATAPTKKEQIETVTRKNKFSPMSTTQETYFNQPKKVREDFYAKIKGLLPNSTFAELMAGKRLSKEESSNGRCKPDLTDLAEHVRNSLEDKGLSTDSLVKKLVSNMSMTEREIAFLKKNTVGQSENPLWINQRKGRLTASKFKSTYTRANTL